MKNICRLLLVFSLASCFILSGCSATQVHYNVINTFTLSYENKDGTKTMEIYSYPVAFLNNSHYQQIDNTIVEVLNEDIRKAGYEYENKANDIKLYFPDSFDGDLGITAIDQENYITIKPKGQVSNGVLKRKVKTIYCNEQEAIVYQNISDYVDLLVYPTSLGAKMQLDIKRQPKDDFIIFHISTPDTHILTKNQEYVSFTNQDKETKAILHQPFIVDTKDDFFMVEGWSVLETAPGLYTYTLPMHIKDTSIQYPISIDLSINLYRPKQPDSSVKSFQEGNQYLSNLLFTGSNNRGDMASYIRFELLNENLLHDKTILSAHYITYDLTRQNHANTIRAYPVIANWGSPSITWSTQPLSLDRETEVYIKQNQYTFDVTEIVKSWYKYAEHPESAPFNNRFGFVLKSDGTDQGYCVFPSADNVFFSPRLKIVYGD